MKPFSDLETLIYLIIWQILWHVIPDHGLRQLHSHVLSQPGVGMARGRGCGTAWIGHDGVGRSWDVVWRWGGWVQWVG